MTATRACILGCAGPALSAEEARVFADARPWGFILFGRNIEAPDQVRALTAALRASVGRPDAPILIDQEGGRVQRLRPPRWRALPPARAIGRLAETDRSAGGDAAWLTGQLVAADLAALAITVACAPVADVPAPGADEVIGDRAYAGDPTLVAELARAMANGLLAGGVLPVVKHVPGHGRAAADSHLALPIVEASLADLLATDFAAFAALADLPAAMTAHVVYAAIDPQRPATTSPKVIQEIVRGEIGFDGLLMSDDLSMKALTGDLGERARASLAAGCDVVLHCNGDPAEMAAVVAATGPLAGRAAERAAAFLARRRPPADATCDAAVAADRLDRLLHRRAVA